MGISGRIMNKEELQQRTRSCLTAQLISLAEYFITTTPQEGADLIRLTPEAEKLSRYP